MKQFAERVIAARLEQVNRELERTRTSLTEGNIHQLRVSIRRLQQALRLFRDLVGRDRASELRGRLRPVLDAAGEVRNADIALALADRAGIERKALLRTRLMRQRVRNLRVLAGTLPEEEIR